MNTAILVVYILGVVVGFGLVIYSIAARLAKGMARRERAEEKSEPTALKVQLKEKIIEERYTGDLMAVHEEALHMRLISPSPLLKAGEIRELAFDTTIGILQATRNSEKAVAKSKARELLDILRNELAVQKLDVTPHEEIQIIRNRIMNLAEMTSEVQLALCEIDHKVIDIESILGQLPEVIQNHRDHIKSLRESVAEIKMTSATKEELFSVQKEISVVKWAFITLFGVVMTVLGWLFTKVVP